MRNTLRLLGIIALVALIGFGLMACNDGSTTTKEELPNQQYPIESDFEYSNFVQEVKPGPQTVLITPKAGKTDGNIIILYDKNGIVDDVPPESIGSYLVTFNVAQSSDKKWGTAKGLVAGYFTITEVGALPITPVLGDFDIKGRGEFKYDGTPRAVVITPNYNAPITSVRYGNRANPFVPIDEGEYDVEFTVGPGNDGTVAYNGTTIVIPSGIVIWKGKPVSREDFLISGRSQIYVAPTDQTNLTRRELKVIPKVGKSTGARTFWYQSDTVPDYYKRSELAPWERGTYQVYMDVADEGPNGKYRAEPKIFIGDLVIGDREPGRVNLELLKNFDVEAFDTEDNWGGSYNWDGGPKAVYIEPKILPDGEELKTGKITVYFTEILDDKTLDFANELVDEWPTDAGAYQVSIAVEESEYYVAGNRGNALTVGSPLVIVPILPQESDFDVILTEYVDNVQRIQIGTRVPIGKDVGEPKWTQTYKNIHYPVSINYKGKVFDNWLNIYYNKVPLLNAAGGDWGPVDADDYEVTFSLKPSKNLLTVGGVSISANVGTIRINKATPKIYHYVVTPNGFTYGALVPDYATVALNYGNTNIDGYVVSDGEWTIKYDGVATPRPLTVKTGGYKLSFSVEETDNWNKRDFTEAEVDEVFTISKRTISLASLGYTVTQKDRHIQSAYMVEGILDYVVPTTIAGVTPAKVYYTNDILNGAPTGTKYTYNPQREGRYYVWVEVDGVTDPDNTQLPATGRILQVLNGYIGSWVDDPEVVAEFEPYGLVVNPLIIRNMTIFEEWLDFVKPNLSAPGFSDIKEYNVVFVLGVDDAARGVFNSATYDFTHNPPGAPANEKIFRDLLDASAVAPAVPLHLNFGFGDSEAFGDTPNTDMNTNFSSSVIAAETFAGLTNIQKVTFPADGEFTLGNDAFKGCSALTEVPNGVAIILDGVFQETAVTGLVLDTVLRSIGNSAFADLTSFTSITIPVDEETGDEVAVALETILSNAFENTALKELRIPLSVVSIGDAAFAGCTALRLVEFKENTTVSFPANAFPGDLKEKFDDVETGDFGEYTRDTVNITSSWTNQRHPNIIELPK
jgi:hypothetical protein